MSARNPIGLHVLFSLLGLGVSLLLLGIGGQFMLELQRHEDYRDEGEMVAGIIFCAGGVICLFFSIALILRLEWARVAFQVLLVLMGIAWMTMIVFLARESPQTWVVLIGMTAAGLLMVLFGVLFLESPAFRKDLRNEQTTDKDRWDILDR